jgi:parallel beta-helix repeat protein
VKLNGHIISGPSSLVGAGINIFPQPPATRLDHIAVQGPGLVKGYLQGIQFLSTDYSQVSQVTVTDNHAIQSVGQGINADSNTFLTISSNVIARNTGQGVLLTNSTNCVVSNNELTANSDGIQLSGGGANTVNNNTAIGNNIGIHILGNGSRVYGNVTDSNGQSGIMIEHLASGNQIFSNKSSVGNGNTDLVDLNPPTCGSNFWGDNVFLTRNLPACIR